MNNSTGRSKQSLSHESGNVPFQLALQPTYRSFLPLCSRHAYGTDYRIAYSSRQLVPVRYVPEDIRIAAAHTHTGAVLEDIPLVRCGYSCGFSCVYRDGEFRSRSSVKDFC